MLSVKMKKTAKSTHKLITTSNHKFLNKYNTITKIYLCIIHIKTNKQRKSIHSGGRWNLISPAGKPEQKLLY